MDMDFDFSDFSRNDFIADIDSDGLDFHNLEQFMQVAVDVGALDGQQQLTSNEGGQSVVDANATVGNMGGMRQTKIDSTHSPPSTNGQDVKVAKYVNITSPSMGRSQAASHANLPESPPDSGSEPAYSPQTDGHCLSGRDIYQSLAPIQQLQQQQTAMLHAELQYTPPHQQQSTSHSPFTPHMQPPPDVRLKHEAGLIMSPSSLFSQPHQGQQQALCEPSLLESHHQQHEIQPHLEEQLLYQPQTSQLLYDNMQSGSGLYGGTSYQNLSSILSEQVTTCMLTSTLGDRVQVVGTSQVSLNRTSAPSTPVHSLSRKRKMSTQLDCHDYGSNVKHNAGLVMSPLRASQHSLASDGSHFGQSASSSFKLNLPPMHSSHSELSKTPAHSSASVSPALSTINSATDNSLDGHASNSGMAGNVGSGGSEAGDQALSQCIHFSPFQPENWHKLCDQSLQELSVVYYRVDADKGFNFSCSDDAFVCQKKNHFQVTCHARLQGDAKFVKTPSGLEKIKSFHLHFYGVKFEAPNQTIRVEQSQSDRSKKPFYPVPIDLQSHIVSKITVGRLHFSETTNNNMRKKGRPNPEQRYFQLVVGLHVHTTSGNFPVVSHGSERIIVRASNPGQFESDVDLCWQRGLTADSIIHTGRVGINTDRPDESLVVHGNLKVSGHIVQPSDSRAKQEIAELDTSVQLRNLQKIRIVRYRYEPEFALHSGLRRASDTNAEEIVDTGVIAQEVREVIPDAVQEAGSVVLPNGNVIEKFLLVNKDRILMENIGAVKELCKVTGSLETRIEYLERANSNQNPRAKNIDPRCLLAERMRVSGNRDNSIEICSSRTVQIIIFLLIIIMAACLAAVSTLYFVEHSKQQQQLDSYQLLGSGHMLRPDATLHISEENRHLLQHNLQTLLKNKTFIAWPSLMYATSSSRPPGAQNDTRLRNEDEDINEELAVVMAKQLVPIPIASKSGRFTTTAPRANKTLNSKNKGKWPLPQEVLRSTQGAQKLVQGVAPRVSTTARAHLPAELLPQANNNLTSSDKTEGIQLQQDIENNSIDIDAQHQQRIDRKALDVGKVANVRAAPIAVNEETVDAQQPQSDDITLKLHEQIVVVDTAASTSSSNSLNEPDTTAAAAAGQVIRKLNTGDAVIYNVFKTVSPPTADLTTNNVATQSQLVTQGHVALDVPPTTVRSNRHDNAEALDLQNLSNTNESVDNPITAVFDFEYPGLRDSSVGRRSANQRNLEWIKQKTIKTEVFGRPADCNRDDANGNYCQSACLEELRPPNQSTDNVDANVKQPLLLQRKLDDALQSAEQEQESDALDTSVVFTNDTLIVEQVHHGKSSHATETEAKLYSTETDVSGGDDPLYTVIDDAVQSAKQLEPAPKTMDVDVAHLDAKNGSVGQPAVLPINQIPLNCWTISSHMLSSQHNRTIDVEHYCPSVGSSLNVSYIVPVSRYLTSGGLELHLSSDKPLQWSICSNEHALDPSKGSAQVNEDDDADDNSHGNGFVKIVKQSGNNKLVLALDIPSRGYFLRYFMLRASHDLEQQKLCDDDAHVVDTILQYNFSIIRDCDQLSI